LAFIKAIPNDLVFIFTSMLIFFCDPAKKSDDRLFGTDRDVRNRAASTAAEQARVVAEKSELTAKICAK